MVIRRIKGDNYPVKVQISSEDGTAFDLTNCTCFFTVKKRFEDTDAEALISVDTTTHVDSLEGITEFEMVNENVNLIGSFIYDIKVKDSNDIIYSVITDKIIFDNHVTIRTS